MRSLFFALALLGAASACTSHKVLEIQNAPVSHNVSDPAPAIEGALADRGWQVVSRSPGLIDATILVRQHRADIRITYDARSYSIGYRGSENLEAKNGRIHRTYNNWVTLLDQNIQQRLLERSGLAPPPAGSGS